MPYITVGQQNSGAIAAGLPSLIVHGTPDNLVPLETGAEPLLALLGFLAGR